MAILDLITQDKPSYRQLLQDARWIAKAKSHRASHNFCNSCRRAGIEIQVHHTIYDHRKPWEYNDDELVSLCPECHEKMHLIFKAFKVIMSRHNATNMTALVGLVKYLLDQNDEQKALEKMARLLK